MKKRSAWSGYISPVSGKPKKLDAVVAFDIETEQTEVDEEVSSYRIKQVSTLMFGTACFYVLREKYGGKVDAKSSELGFQETVEDYFLADELFFKKKEEFTQWLLDWNRRVKRLYVYAHNISFDIRESVDFKMLKDAGYELTIFNPQSKQFIVKFQKQSSRDKTFMVFTDTLNLYPSSLKQIGKVIGLEKLDTELELDRARLKEAIERGRMKDVLLYNVRDTQIVANAVIIRQKVVNELGGNLRLTNPSTAMDLFRRRFLKKPIRKLPKAWAEMVRKSYFGGRTEVYFRGIVATPGYREAAYELWKRKKARYKEYGFDTVEEIHYVDINSLYPYVMKYFPSPVKHLFIVKGRKAVNLIKDYEKVGLIVQWDMLDPLESVYRAWKKQVEFLKASYPDKAKLWEGLEAELENRKGSDRLLELRSYFKPPLLYITHAKVRVPRKDIREATPPLPVRLNGKLVFPTGTFEGWWTCFELDLSRPPCEVIDVHKVLFFESDWIFIEYVDTFYTMKNEAKKSGDSVMYLVSKLFMNSLYGKWAERKRVSVLMSKERLADFIIDYAEKKQGNYVLELALDTDYGIIRADRTQLNVIGGYVEVKTTTYHEPYNVAVATFITSAARAVNRAYQELVKKNGGLVFYTDTDSFIVDKKGFEALKPYIDKLKLGYLDEELQGIAFVEINTLKDYKVYMVSEPPKGEPERHAYLMKITSKDRVKWFYKHGDEWFKVKYKLKGVPLTKAVNLENEDDSAFAVERLIGLREFLKYGKFGLFWIEQKKEVKRVYDKAEKADGWVVPYNL